MRTELFMDNSRFFSGNHNITYVRSNFRIPFAGVYIVWSASGEALYVGASVNVLKRSNKKRSHSSRDKAFIEADSIEVYPCESLRQALHLEAELIGIYSPKYNLNNIYQYSRSFQQLQQEHAKLFAEVQP